MDKRRVINTNFWKDNYIVELDPIEKLLFLYLFTNPRTTLLGVYEINIREIAFDTGIDKDMIIKIIGRFEQDDKVHYKDGWIMLVNFLKNQSLNPSMVKNLTKVYLTLPNIVKEAITFDEVNSKVLFIGWVQDGDTLSTSKVKESKVKESKYKVNTYGDKSPVIVENSVYEQISKAYYDAIRALELPVNNHNTLRKRISELSKMQDTESILGYLRFMRDDFRDAHWPYKPDVSEALDIYRQRVKIKNSIQRARREINSSKGVYL